MKVKRNFIKTRRNSDSVSFSAGRCAAKISLPAAAQYPDTFMQRTPSFPPFRTRPPPSCTFRSADVKNKFHECFLFIDKCYDCFFLLTSEYYYRFFFWLLQISCEFLFINKYFVWFFYYFPNLNTNFLYCYPFYFCIKIS